MFSGEEIIRFFENKNFELSRRFSYEYSPEPVRKTLKQLSQPQLEYKTIHVAGTVGKGSTVNFLSRMLTHEGFKVGSFYSPHLTCLNERIQINHEEISNEELSELWTFMKKHTRLDRLSFFDCLSVMAFLYFKEKKVDWAVIETGLGGRLDSTNNLETEFSVITPIGRDHESVLGDSIEKIAFEKAGIIHSQPVFSYPQVPPAAGVLKKEADERGSSICFHSDFDAHSQESYQQKNLMICEWVYSQYFKKPPPEVSIEFRGRLEVLSTAPRVVFDSAHNIPAMQELGQWLSRQETTRKWRIYMNTLKSRDISCVLEPLLSCAKEKIESFYLFPIENTEDKERFHTQTSIGEASNHLRPLKDLHELKNLLQQTEYSHLICGSMYLYGMSLFTN